MNKKSEEFVKKATNLELKKLEYVKAINEIKLERAKLNLEAAKAGINPDMMPAYCCGMSHTVKAVDLPDESAF